MAANPITWMLIASLACWAFVSLLVGLDGQGGVLLGLIAPLAVTVGSWIAIERTHHQASSAGERRLSLARTRWM